MSNERGDREALLKRAGGAAALGVLGGASRRRPTITSHRHAKGPPP